uniref:VPS37 C-terminal domain-containing protein n=1 Tax=Scophthalmus maximus TaxID=52904 RepID=A0A8D3AWU2_SCOMX
QTWQLRRRSGPPHGGTCPDGYRALSTGELRELLRDDDKMDRIIRLNETFQELQVDRETLLTSNRSVAEESLARRPRLNSGKLQLAEKYRELSNLATACWEKQNARVQKRSPQTVQNLLQEEVARAEEHSEKFMEGNVSVDEFLDAFQSSRKTYHVRRAQAEKTQEIAQATRQPCKSNGTPPPEPQPGQTHILSPGTPLPGHGQPVGLRVIGQLSGGWPANGRPVRVQQLYRPNPQQPEPPFR